MNDVFVVGAAMTPFGPSSDDAYALAHSAVWDAIQDSGCHPRDVTVAAAGHVYQGSVFAQKVLKRMGLSGIAAFNTENACASGANAVAIVSAMIASGQADLGVAFGAERLSRPSGGFLPLAEDDLDSSMGRVMPAAFAMGAQLHMGHYGTTREQFAAVAVKNRRNGSLNPLCHMRSPVTVEEVLAAPVIANPLTRLMCCPVSDGAAAVILASPRAADRLQRRQVRLASSVLVSGARTPRGIVDDASEMTIRAAAAAYEQSAIGPGDVDVCELHDPFASAEIIHYEDLGFCPAGEGGAFVESGRADIGGEVAVSPSGGLLAKGHPLGATGVAQVAEVYWHLRGSAGARQVPGARVGVAHTVGGGVSGIESGACAVHILKV